MYVTAESVTHRGRELGRLFTILCKQIYKKNHS